MFFVWIIEFRFFWDAHVMLLDWDQVPKALKLSLVSIGEHVGIILLIRFAVYTLAITS